MITVLSFQTVNVKLIMGKISKEEVDRFIQGSDPTEGIVKIECGYDEDMVTIYYRDKEGKKHITKDEFHPFCWCKRDTARRLFKGNRQLIMSKMAEYGISCKGLRTTKEDGTCRNMPS